jgi:hypothetical protein
MKKCLLFAVILLIGLNACKKSETETKTPVKGCMDPASLTYNPEATEDDGTCTYPPNKVAPKEQRDLIMNVTATWCHVCGEIGEQGFRYAISKHKSKIVPVSLHNDDLLPSSIAGQINSAISSTKPSFIEGSEKILNGAMSDTSYFAINFLGPKINAVVANAPLANTYIGRSVSGTKLTVETKTKFFAAANGEYYLSVYILENNIVAKQTDDSPTGYNLNFVHNYVLRDAMSANYYGESIASGAIAINKEISKTYTKTIPGNWKAANLQVATIIWKKENGSYTYVNSYIK